MPVPGCCARAFPCLYVCLHGPRGSIGRPGPSTGAHGKTRLTSNTSKRAHLDCPHRASHAPSVPLRQLPACVSWPASPSYASGTARHLGIAVPGRDQAWRGGSTTGCPCKCAPPYLPIVVVVFHVHDLLFRSGLATSHPPPPTADGPRDERLLLHSLTNHPRPECDRGRSRKKRGDPDFSFISVSPGKKALVTKLQPGPGAPLRG